MMWQTGAFSIVHLPHAHTVAERRKVRIAAPNQAIAAEGIPFMGRALAARFGYGFFGVLYSASFWNFSQTVS
jgi:hypothetical protein